MVIISATRCRYLRTQFERPLSQRVCLWARTLWNVQLTERPLDVCEWPGCTSRCRLGCGAVGVAGGRCAQPMCRPLFLLSFEPCASRSAHAVKAPSAERTKICCAWEWWRGRAPPSRLWQRRPCRRSWWIATRGNAAFAHRLPTGKSSLPPDDVGMKPTAFSLRFVFCACLSVCARARSVCVCVCRCVGVKVGFGSQTRTAIVASAQSVDVDLCAAWPVDLAPWKKTPSAATRSTRVEDVLRRPRRTRRRRETPWMRPTIVPIRRRCRIENSGGRWRRERSSGGEKSVLRPRPPSIRGAFLWRRPPFFHRLSFSSQGFLFVSDSAIRVAAAAASVFAAVISRAGRCWRPVRHRFIAPWVRVSDLGFRLSRFGSFSASNTGVIDDGTRLVAPLFPLLDAPTSTDTPPPRLLTYPVLPSFSYIHMDCVPK